MREDDQPGPAERKQIRQRLREGAEQRSARDHAIAEEWAPLEEEANGKAGRAKEG